MSPNQGKTFRWNGGVDSVRPPTRE
uniref:Uncharacterized protein n=1 Tax=Anguilla anguilla TaxID=7936 RepID=A0A0E9VQG8_ANGAN